MTAHRGGCWWLGRGRAGRPHKFKSLGHRGRNCFSPTATQSKQPTVKEPRLAHMRILSSHHDGCVAEATTGARSAGATADRPRRPCPRRGRNSFPARNSFTKIPKERIPRDGGEAPGCTRPLADLSISLSEGRTLKTEKKTPAASPACGGPQSPEGCTSLWRKALFTAGG